MAKHYEVVDMLGRRWITAMTASKAVKLAREIETNKGLKCQVKELDTTEVIKS